MAYSILVAEDEPNIVLSLKFILDKAGYEVRVAKDGERALREIEIQKPNLILLDIMLPKRDGYSVCESIRANPDWADIKIVILSAKSRDIDKQKATELGADDYITKPFSTKALVGRVTELLQSTD